MTHRLPSLALIAAALVVLAPVAAAPSVALAQASLADQKAIVDAAKAQGVAGEQADGYLGIRTGGDAALQAAVAAINSGRAAAYREAAAKAGVTVDAAAGAAAAQLIARVPPGQYYRTQSGDWVRK